MNQALHSLTLSLRHRLAPAQTAKRRSLPRRALRGIGVFSVILGIILLVIFLLFLARMYNSATTSVSSMQILNQMQRITAAVDSAYANSGDYGTSDLLPVLYSSGSFSKKTMPDNATMWSPYHTKVIVTGATDKYTVEYTLPLAGCTALLNSFSGATSTKLLSVTVGGTAVTVPPTPTDVAKACSDAAGNTNDVVLTF
ncbi:MAG: hypothetical protein KGK00_02165 [Paracoccaceae bacterium]|nr:hypothetical protein [Paracoccaceae bacterium]